MDIPVSQNPVRILIVDDHPNTANMLARVLSRFETPVEVITASSGEDALTKIGDRVVDVLITDFMMPGMNGLELIERLKGDQKPAHTILITAYDTPGLVITARRLQVQDYLVKPVQPEKIRSIVMKVIEELRPKPSPIAMATFKRSFKILVADDYPDNLRLLSTRLASEGYTFIAAWDGEEALRKVREEEPDLVLLDVNMPKLDGFQVLAALRNDSTTEHIPVIMITAARIGPKDVREGLTLGADDYVIKPFDWRELAARMQSKLRVKQAEDILRRRTKELGILPEIGQELSAQLDIDAVVNVVVNRTSEALTAIARLDVYQPNGEVYCRQRSREKPDPQTLEIDRGQSTRWGVNAQVLNSRLGLVVENTKRDPWWQAGSEPLATASAVAVPLLGRHKVIGVLTLMHHEVAYFNVEHQTLLQAVASQAAIAIENSQLFDVEHRRVQELMSLNEISQEINRFTHKRQLLDGLPGLIKEHLGYPSVAVWLAQEALVAEGTAASALFAEAAPAAPLAEPDADGAAGSVDLDLFSMVGGSPELNALDLAEVAKQVVRGGKPVLAQGVNKPSMAAVPLQTSSQVNGALAIYSVVSNVFQESDTALLQALATQVAAALDRVGLFESVEHEQRRLLAVLHSAADAILVLDNQERLTLANPAGERLFGDDVDTCAEQPLSSKEGYGDLAALLAQGHETGVHQQGEVSWPDGRTFSAMVTPIEEGGQVVLLHDITQFRVLAEMKNEYIGTAAHDLKNPLMAVMGYNDLLVKMGPLNDLQMEFSRRIANSAMLMRDLVLNLLEISRLESGTAMKLEDLDLHTLLQEGANSLKDQADAKGQTLTVSLEADQPIVRGDRMLLQQLINNLLGNAIKYTPPNKSIALITHPIGRQVEILFQDTGIGISADDLPHIFKKFYRVDNDDTKDIEGTGLGLAIVKSIVENHKGTITVESQRGVGTTFTVCLPVQPPK